MFIHVLLVIIGTVQYVIVLTCLIRSHIAKFTTIPGVSAAFQFIVSQDEYMQKGL